MMHKNDPLIYSDFPDPDVIRVDDTYYSTFAAQNRQVHLNIIGQTRKPLL